MENYKPSNDFEHQVKIAQINYQLETGIAILFDKYQYYNPKLGECNDEQLEELLLDIDNFIALLLEWKGTELWGSKCFPYFQILSAYKTRVEAFILKP